MNTEWDTNKLKSLAVLYFLDLLSTWYPRRLRSGNRQRVKVLEGVISAVSIDSGSGDSHLCVHRWCHAHIEVQNTTVWKLGKDRRRSIYTSNDATVFEVDTKPLRRLKPGP